MKQATVIGCVAALGLFCSLPVPAQDAGLWRAASKTAESVTGDIALSDAKISFNLSTFDIVRARDLEPGEVSSVFDTDSNSGKKGHLYGLNIAATKKFLHRNTLCGSEDTHWMVSYVDGKALQLAFFSGAKAPVFTPDAIANSTSLCGTYTYVR
jgi:hypothetical protein